jgi:transcriptional regulator with XRE-family HTH domain
MVGDRLRRARLGHHFSVRQMAALAGLSKTSVVQAEAGRTSRRSTYEKLGVALHLRMESLLSITQSSVDPYSVHRQEDDRWYRLAHFNEGPIPDQTETARRAVGEAGFTPFCFLSSRLHGGAIKPNVLEVYRQSEKRSHPGEEFAMVMSGRAVLEIGESVIELSEGESVTFWSGEPHSYGPAPDSPLPVRILSVRVDP